MSKLHLPAADTFLILACLCALAAYYLHLVPPDQAEFILGLVAMAGLLPVLWSAGQALIQFHITIDLLASVALIFSLLNQEWTSAVFINLMLASARIFSAYTQDSIRQALKYLVKLRPQQARVQRNDTVAVVPVSQVLPGQHVVVEIGERIPVDGIVISGEASIDQSSFTGESLPVIRQRGDRVLGSTVVLSGNLEIAAEKVGTDTAFEHIVQLVESAQNNKARVTGIADKFAAFYIVLILLAAGIIYSVSGSLELVLSVLLVVCADDIAVAIPLSMTAAMSYAARNGVIIKGANFLEGMANVKTMVMDKTGTLTQGRLRVTGFQMFNNIHSQADMLGLAVGLASHSTHPVSKAVVDYAKALRVDPVDVERFAELGGQGLVAAHAHKDVFLGRLSYMAELGVSVSTHQKAEINKNESMGYNVTVLAYDKQLVGIFTLRDEIKPEANEVIAQLKMQGVKEIVLLTGDNPNIARQTALSAGITHYKANLLPEDKLKYLRSRLSAKRKTVMVGDGVNDAPALALADIGIAMGALGSDVAVESADIVIMQDSLCKIPQTITLAQRVLQIARQNFVYWGLSNVVGLILVFSGVLTPAGAAAYNFITDFVPILNAMRILRSRTY